MISALDIRRVLTKYQITPVPFEELADDTPFVLDSLNLVWLLHILEEEYGITVDPYGADLDHFTSVHGIHTYLVEQGETPRHAGQSL